MKLNVFPRIIVFVFAIFPLNAVVDFCAFEDSFLGIPYKVTLFDVKPLFKDTLPRCSFQESSDCSMFCLAAKVDAYDNIKSFEGKCIDVSDSLGNENGIYFEGRVLDSFDYLNRYNDKSFKYDLKFLSKNEEIRNEHKQTIYNRDLGIVPIICYKGGEAVHARANLYDMFSAQVDDYLLSYGIAEWIVHENENKSSEQQLQVSVFGAIEISEENFFQLGFFQYTFNAEGHCYHRAFKPWTIDCLKHISNSKTQMVLRTTLLNWLKSLKSDPVGELHKKMVAYQCYDPFIEILRQACVY